MARSKLLLKRGQIELWESWSNPDDQSLFVVISPDGVYCFPPFNDLDNSRQARDCVRHLREKYNVRQDRLRQAV